MLGRLDEDLSCANSRFFRTTLYANTEVVASSCATTSSSTGRASAPVPRVTIDFGDGRKIERTTTGNSAHYVLDADRQRARRAARPLRAGRVRGRADQEPRARAAASAASTTCSARTRSPTYHRPRCWRRRPSGSRRWPARRTSAAAAACSATDEVGASAVDARAARHDVEDGGRGAWTSARSASTPARSPPRTSRAWAVVGQKVWNIGRPGRHRRPAQARRPAPPTPALVLDAASRALVARVHDAGRP